MHRSYLFAPASANRPRPAKATSATKAAAQGEPLINAMRSFGVSSIRVLNPKNSVPSAKISPEPPFD
jgi:hypothetical protein